MIGAFAKTGFLKARLYYRDLCGLRFFAEDELIVKVETFPLLLALILGTAIGELLDVKQDPNVSISYGKATKGEGEKEKQLKKLQSWFYSAPA